MSIRPSGSPHSIRTLFATRASSKRNLAFAFSDLQQLPLGLRSLSICGPRPNHSLERTCSAARPGFAGSAARHAAQLEIRYPAGHHFFSVAGNLGGFGEVSGSSGFGTIVEAERFRPSGWPHDAVPCCDISTSATRPLALAVSDSQPRPLGPRSLSVCGRRYNNSLKRTRSAAIPGFAGSASWRAA